MVLAKGAKLNHTTKDKKKANQVRCSHPVGALERPQRGDP